MREISQIVFRIKSHIFFAIRYFLTNGPEMDLCFRNQSFDTNNLTQAKSADKKILHRWNIMKEVEEGRLLAGVKTILRTKLNYETLHTWINTTHPVYKCVLCYWRINRYFHYENIKILRINIFKECSPIYFYQCKPQRLFFVFVEPGSICFLFIQPTKQLSSVIMKTIFCTPIKTSAIFKLLPNTRKSSCVTARGVPSAK